MSESTSLSDVEEAYGRVRSRLLQMVGPDGVWIGELSTSALSTATAVMAFEQVARRAPERRSELQPLIDGGLKWLASHQNEDGGWGDTTLSFSNISTTMLVHATLVAASTQRFTAVVDAAQRYIEQAGGVDAVLARYGKDRTFSIPILTHCALAGTCSWKRVIALPFELACVPARFYQFLRLPVVSYALPALIAIGQAIHVHRPSWNPVVRWVRERTRRWSLRVLERIQPSNGGFLEATPLTSFVTMSLASIGLDQHPVVLRGVEFLRDSVRPDGSWPIDTNLATWVTTLSIHSLDTDLPTRSRGRLVDWILDQQYREKHPYTNANPGGWAWTDLPGGVPDADDTPGAMLALMRLEKHAEPEQRSRIESALDLAVEWLLGLQNRNGGWPTFCRGWGALPFDRSSCDITAHVLRALTAWRNRAGGNGAMLIPRVSKAIAAGFRFLGAKQDADGSWLPLWFGNQYLQAEENPVYGTSRVLLAYAGQGSPQVARATRLLVDLQNPDGGWGAGEGSPSTVEETSLCLEALLDSSEDDSTILRGLNWLVERSQTDAIEQPSPIGFYFAKLWYFERLYPLIYACSALRIASRDSRFRSTQRSSNEGEVVSAGPVDLE